MGRYGSGRRWGGARGHVEAYLQLDVRWLHRKGWLRPGVVKSLTWSNTQTGEQIASIGLRTNDNLVVLSYRHSAEGEERQGVEEPVHLAWTRCNYGGQRPWFFCPGVVNGVRCGRLAAILYCAGPYFLCRHCYQLAYARQRWDRRDRRMEKARGIRMRLGGSVSLLESFPPKPKRMHWKTYSRLRLEAGS